MKKKVLFITLAVIQSIFAIYSIFTAETIVNNSILEMEEILMSSPEYIKDIYEQVAINEKQIIISAIISIIVNIFVIVICVRNNVLKKKKLLLALFVINFAVIVDSKALFLQLITAILLISFRRKIPEDYPEVPKEIPKLSPIKLNKREVIFTIILVVIYVLQAFIPIPNIAWLQLVIVVLLYAAIFGFAICAYFREIKEGIIALKNNFLGYFNLLLPQCGIMYLIFFISRIITIGITNEIDSINQQEVEMLPIFILAPLAIIWAPVVEEVLFRGVIRRIIKNDTLFIIVSAIIFGALHAIGESNFTNIVATTIPYAVLGGYFAYVYKKTGNITECILSHAAFNSIGVLASFMQ